MGLDSDIGGELSECVIVFGSSIVPVTRDYSIIYLSVYLSMDVDIYVFAEVAVGCTIIAAAYPWQCILSLILLYFLVCANHTHRHLVSSQRLHFVPLSAGQHIHAWQMALYFMQI